MPPPECSSLSIPGKNRLRKRPLRTGAASGNARAGTHHSRYRGKRILEDAKKKNEEEKRKQEAEKKRKEEEKERIRREDEKKRLAEERRKKEQAISNKVAGAFGMGNAEVTAKATSAFPIPKAPATLLLMACSFLRRSSARRFFSASSRRIRSFSSSSFRFFSASLFLAFLFLILLLASSRATLP